MVLAEIGLQHQRRDGQRQKRERHDVARHVLPPRAFRKRPGGEDHEGRLHEFGRLDAEYPAAGALDLDTPT